MDSIINIFLDMLHYVPYIKDKKVNIQQFLGCLSPNFRERIEFDMTKTMETTLHKVMICYENGKLRQENINISWDRSRTFSDNRKPGFKSLPYIKENKSFRANNYFNKTGAKPSVPAPNNNRPATNGGAKAALLQVNCWKFQGPHNARDCPNETNWVLHNL